MYFKAVSLQCTLLQRRSYFAKIGRLTHKIKGGMVKMGLMVRYVLRYKKFLLLNLVGVASFVGIQIGIPTLLKYIVNDSLMVGNVEVLKQLVIAMLVIAIVGLAGQMCMTYANSRIASNVIRDMRGDIFKQTQHFSHAEFDKFGVPELITSTTSDAYQIMMFLQTMLRSAFITPVMTITGFILIVQTNPKMAWIVLVTVPVLSFGIWLITKKSAPYSERQQALQDNINLVMRESITGLRVIRAFGNEEFQDERFEKINSEYTGVSKKLFRIMGLSQPCFNLLFSLMMAVIIWVSAQEIGAMQVDVGALSATIEYVFHILFSFLMLGALIVMYPRAAVSANRIQKILETVPSIQENTEEGVTNVDKKGTIDFQDVSFSYAPGAESAILQNINFSVNKGDTVAIIGSTGSGKSSLIQLIPRIYDVTEGTVLVNGVDVRNYNIHALRNMIGYVPQKAQLFTGTIEYNLKIGNPDLTMEQIEKAAEIAQATDFINSKSEGYQSFISEGGSNLSGGQRQRLAIARAVAKPAEIYVFDDSFSALDYSTDLKVRTAIKRELKGATVVIVAQRIGTIRHADKIIVLDNGKIVGQGTHDELMDNCGVYYDIAVSQLSQEELG